MPRIFVPHPLLIPFVAFATLVASGCGTPRANRDRVDSFAQWVAEQSIETAAADATFLVITSGHSNARTIELTTPSHQAARELLPVGSVTKILTAILVLQAAEEGLLKLDDPALAEASGGDSISYRHLLEHRAGFLDRRMDPTLLEAAIPILPPGLLVIYSNEGYAALARKIEVTLGSQFDDLVAERIFTPLGMNNAVLTALGSEWTWSPPMGSSGFAGSRDDLALLVSATARRDERILSPAGWDTLFDLRLWDVRESKSKRGRGALIQEGRVTGSRSTLIAMPAASAALLIYFTESDEDGQGRMNALAQSIQNEAIRRWGSRLGSLRQGRAEWSGGVSRPTDCRECDWSNREGVYVSRQSGEQLVIVEVEGEPKLIDDRGRILSIGPEMVDGISRYHDLFEPYINPADAPFRREGIQSGLLDSIEFGARDGKIIGLLRGVEWYEKTTN